LFRRNILEEEFMACYQIERLIRLHKKAERHSNEYKRLLGDRSAQSKALWHLQKAERLYSQVSSLIRDFTLTPAGMAGNLPDSGFPARQN
jgi:hypothetical protein